MFSPPSIVPNLPAHQMRTYQLAAPLATHWRRATCEEVQCKGWRLGWATRVDESTDIGQKQAHFIRNPRQYGAPLRRYVETREASGVTAFDFAAGQPCFDRSSHRLPLEREPLYVVRGGDWRGNPRGEVRQHGRADQWVDDCANHLDRIGRRIQRG